MREIKFRAWHKELEDMKYYPSYHHPLSAMFDLAKRYKDMYILMQFTGLKDKNGKEKYFDDIIKITWRMNTDSYIQQGDDYMDFEYIAKIEWKEDRIVYRLFNGKILNYPKDAEFEVIGNIYENPELLKEKQ